jgi:hypothetical protein
MSVCHFSMATRLKIAYIHHWVSGIAPYYGFGLKDKKVEDLEIFLFLNDPSCFYMSVTM